MNIFLFNPYLFHHIKHQLTTVNASHPAEHALCDTRRLAPQNNE